MACSTAYAALSTIINENLSENSAIMGEYLISRLNQLKDEYSFIREVRGKGLMIALEFNTSIAVEVKLKALEKGFLIGSVGNNIVRMLPPLIITKEDIDLFISALDDILKEYY